MNIPEQKPAFPYSAFPDGWYVAGFSSSLARGEVKRLTAHGQNWVLWRTESGRAFMSDAYCPHMGAHLGHGGKVRGEAIECPFHLFCFDGNGACVSTPYGTKVPPKAKLPMVPLEEKHGLLLAWFHSEGHAPHWQVPALDMTGWLPLATEEWVLETHPQETTENSVDLGHLPAVHGYRDVEILKPVEVHGPLLTTRYAVTRKGLPFITKDFRMEFTISVWGLGYSFVDVEVPAFRMKSRNFVLVSPIDGRHSYFRSAMTVSEDTDPKGLSPALAILPKALALRLVRAAAFRGYVADIKQDLDIWQTKRYVEPPALAVGDGPIGVYRRYCRQFYSELRPAAQSVAQAS